MLQAWGDDGAGVRAVLDVEGLRTLVADLLAEVQAVQAGAEDGTAAAVPSGPGPARPVPAG